ncbi:MULTISPECIES: YrhK family protein [unclassified Modicisalibacter]|uniref:YrhK family protein n=1 Tax=unclassified Modicisalibacter TaxID=2679913 RepID=UPI001CCB2AE0|nr:MULTISPECIES: YrhK family protein [unclassified Modicisalibacter]MBZ9557260.1 YrhK family protein [Modicisalibacter sp. R2A 31.J]MBZ9574026.1 YrhK family protein [Modicisalibacter sp. MOD 31.J]
MRKERNSQNNDWTFTFGHEELVIHQRYEVLSIVNDFMLGVWFTLGSVCFFFEGTLKTIGVWLFVIGSVQLLIRPIIRLHRYIRFKRLPGSDQDY